MAARGLPAKRVRQARATAEPRGLPAKRAGQALVAAEPPYLLDVLGFPSAERVMAYPPPPCIDDVMERDFSSATAPTAVDERPAKRARVKVEPPFLVDTVERDFPLVASALTAEHEWARVEAESPSIVDTVEPDFPSSASATTSEHEPPGPTKRARMTTEHADTVEPEFSSAASATTSEHEPPGPTKRARLTAGRLTLHVPAFPACDICGRLNGAFRDIVRSFLARCATPASGKLGERFPGATWQLELLLGGEGKVAMLDVVEEDVASARRVHCDHCTVAGWSRHPVCGKRYHFIIRNEKMPIFKTCERCAMTVELFESRCPSCKQGFPHHDPIDWGYVQLDNPLHLLHGVIHENGFGHLVRINGREGGSTLMAGYQLMDFWHRLCKYLRVRKVSVMDVSKKYGVDYRILHAVTAGCSWYGQWGFELGNGSFGITAEAYRRAISSIASVPLSTFSPYSRSPRNQLQNTIAFYQSLADHPLTTIHDLFLYVMGLATNQSVHKLPAPMHKELAYDAYFEEMTWTDEEIQQAMDIALKILRAADRWVAMRTLKAVTAHPIGSLQLVDYCLKIIGGMKTDDGMAVAVRCNSETNTIEYRLASETMLPKNECIISQDHLLRDIKFLYDAILYPHTMHPYNPERIHEHVKKSAMILMDCKQFIKHYDLEDDFLPQNPSMLQYWCQVELLDHVGDLPRVPPEVITLPQTATVADLKMEVTSTFRNIYLMFQTFVASQLLDCKTASDTIQIKLLFGANGTAVTVHIKGRCVGGERRVAMYRMERGVDEWTVNCSCGAKDDDGERMLSCDACHEWQHTRCAGISDFDQVPKRFVCRSCKLLHKTKSTRPRLMHNSIPNKRCKTDVDTFSHASEGYFLGLAPPR